MTTFRVTDMTCGGCAGRIKRSIVAMDDKACIEFELKERTVLISGTASDAEFAEAIQDAGYTPELIEPPPALAGNAGPDTARCKCRAAHPGVSCCGGDDAPS
ncbi:heavy-metal-associated domain-containing protein [Comamonas thiooxydans]|uniref:heavy-metal-associated domain-containing protein n=1 Tax=Comamonas thiooxydans TaxID=363952 RepID=UPI0009ECFAFE|nr:heavy-metal-associated domain-containing protein [Comamonas thiooxydans]MCO8249050.1 heavy-metal-associated domain-containing protein [Comamonas thiooxydans]UBQ41192.1 heavy-metal-associated domain-containing protein [Comamonas thiooxydans]